MRKHLHALSILLPTLLMGCSAYTTPGRGVSMQSLAATDADIRERFERKPAAAFPARIATARVQDREYRSYRNWGYGGDDGKFSVVTNRDVETDSDFERLRRLPMVATLAPINRMVLPAKLESDRDLRAAAASLHADILLAYSFDTRYRIDGRDIGPLGLVTLGFLPVNDAVVTSTACAALFDVRTGFVYGMAEVTETEKRLASAWSSESAADDARVAAERKSFEKLLGEVEVVWKQVVEQNAAKVAATP